MKCALLRAGFLDNNTKAVLLDSRQAAGRYRYRSVREDSLMTPRFGWSILPIIERFRARFVKMKSHMSIARRVAVVIPDEPRAISPAYFMDVRKGQSGGLGTERCYGSILQTG